MQIECHTKELELLRFHILLFDTTKFIMTRYYFLSVTKEMVKQNSHGSYLLIYLLFFLQVKLMNTYSLQHENKLEISHKLKKSYAIGECDAGWKRLGIVGGEIEDFGKNKRKYDFYKNLQ